MYCNGPRREDRGDRGDDLEREWDECIEANQNITYNQSKHFVLSLWISVKY